MLDIEKISPMLCNKIIKENLSMIGPNWLVEKKYDGFRTLVFVKDETHLYSRNKYDLTHNFPEFEDMKNWLNCDECILDGELVINPNNNDFDILLGRFSSKSEFKIKLYSYKYPATFIVFDILWLDGKNLTKQPLMKRKLTLKEVVNENDRIKVIRYYDEPEKLFERVLAAGGEGIVLKDIYSHYVFKRSDRWVKCKREEYKEVPVVGWKEGGQESIGDIKTPIGDVELLYINHKKELDQLVEKYGFGNFKAMIKFQELNKRTGMARFPVFKYFIEDG